MGSFVQEAQERIERELKLESGYYLDWGGQFENMQRAERRLFIVVPLALALDPRASFTSRFIRFGMP